MINNRLNTFDFIRGTLVLFAVLEHYVFFSNMIFVKYLSFPVLDSPVSMTKTLLNLMKYIGPWGTQLFIALATFNLTAFRRDDDFSEYKKRDKLYAGLFLFFTVESLFISSNLAEALSPNPLQVWMIILFSLNRLLHKFSLKTVSIILIVLGAIPFLPGSPESFGLEAYGISQLGAEFSFECRPDLFVISSLIGLRLGFLHRKGMSEKSIITILVTALIGSSLFGFYAPEYYVEKYNILFHEYDWAFNFLGALSSWCSVTAIISWCLWMEQRRVGVNFLLINKVGKYCLYYFMFHKLFYVFLVIPIFAPLLLSHLGEYPNNLWFHSFVICLYSLLFFTAQQITRRVRSIYNL